MVVGVIVWVVATEVNPDAIEVLGYQFDLITVIFGVSVNVFVIMFAAIAMILGTVIGTCV